MNQMEIFKNPEFGSIRVIEENGKYLFCGLDIAVSLGVQQSPRCAFPSLPVRRETRRTSPSKF